MVWQIAKVDVFGCGAHCDFDYPLLQICALFSPHYCGPWGWHSHGLCECYETLENIISTDHQVCCMKGATDYLDKHILILADIRSAFGHVRGLRWKPAVTVMSQIIAFDCEH